MATPIEQCQLIVSRLRAGLVSRETATEQIRVVIDSLDPAEAVLAFIEKWFEANARADAATRDQLTLSSSRLTALVTARDVKQQNAVLQRTIDAIARIANSQQS